MHFSTVKNPDISENDLIHDFDVKISGLINTNKNLILILSSRQLKLYFLVKTMFKTIHKLFSIELLLQVEEQKHLALMLKSNLSCEKIKKDKTILV